MFTFLKYINPTWYFNLQPAIDQDYFPEISLENQGQFGVVLDTQYQSTEARQLDAAWCAFHSGYISKDTKPGGMDIWQKAKIPVSDEYRFIRKNYNALWSMYVLTLRIITFHNPFNEFMGWWHNRNVQRVDYAVSPHSYPEYKVFRSNLLNQQPLVSVIIPTLNRYTYLREGLKDLMCQSYRNFEVIVVDQSEPFQEEFYKDWNFPLRYWYQQEKALWKARNEAIKEAKSEFILLFDDDSRVEPDWIEHHIKTLDFFKADISSGVSISQVGDKVPAHYAYFRWSDQLDTGNVMIRRNVFEQIGLFDRQFEKQRMGDGEFGLRAYLAGFRNISNPYAKRIHLKVGEGGLRQMGSWDGWRPKSWLSPRPVPSVLYFNRKYFDNKRSFMSIINSTVPSLIPYRVKRNSGYLVLALLITPFLMPLIIFQVMRSWCLSTKKLQMGSLIPKL